MRAVQKLLAEYGFTRPFQLHDDPTQQDRLTTWIEYLGYECWEHYRHARRVKIKQPVYDAAWKKLVDANVLRPFETEEYVCNIECAIRQQVEEDQANRAVKSANSAAKAVLIAIHKDINNPQGSRYTPEVRVQMMEAAKARLGAAQESLALIKRRNDLVTVFMQAVGEYLHEKGEAGRQRIRLQWILDQIPLIEAESSGASIAETGPDTIRSTKRRLEGDEGDEAAYNRPSKKQRRDASAPGSPGSPPGRRDGHDFHGATGKRSRSHDGAADEAPPPKRLRRGGHDLGSRNETSDGAGAGSAWDSQGHGTPEVEGPQGRERGVRPLERPNSKGSECSNNRLQQTRSTRKAPQPSTTCQPLRHSARIAARNAVLQAVATPSDSFKI